MALVLHSCGCDAGSAEPDLNATQLPDDIVWLDLLNPTSGEAAFVTRVTGLHVPSVAELSEIETSSRLRTENGVITLSMPAVLRSEGQTIITPLGFVLSPERLVTVRFHALAAFDTFKTDIATPRKIHPSSAGAFVGLLEAMVDRMADALENAGGDLDAVSQHVFRDDKKTPGGRARRRLESDLRDKMRIIGRVGDLISKIRDSLMGMSRIVPFTAARGGDWMAQEVKSSLETLRLDLISLNDYDAYLSGKVQFLLDATLGLINIEQNNIIKVLTVVSVVGVPPTLVASWYGMNFKHIPELDWEWGYPYAIVLALVTSILPLIWFRVKGWF
jgi:magnesium transporter